MSKAINKPFKNERPKIGVKNAKATLFRLISFIFSGYKFWFVLMFIAIAVSSFASVQSMSMVEDIVAEVTLQLDNIKLGLSFSYDGILKVLLNMGIIFTIGIIAGFAYSLITVYVAQGTLRRVRDDMFAKMQHFPIKYFDTHTFGDTMSRYTNDTDTLEQLVSQSIPNIFSSIMTVIMCLVVMFVKSWQLTLIVLLTVAIMAIVIKVVGGRSAGYFAAQQRSVGKINGYIEEMVNGQKVVKVFCYEQANKKGFDKLNEELCENTTAANKYANMFMPIMGNLTYIQYAVVAIIGGLMANAGSLIVAQDSNAFALVVAFLLLSRTFTRPINMVSQQFNAVVMALAGAERIFEVMDIKAEVNDGYVTLVKAVINPDGGITEVFDEEKGDWYWKHPHGDGTLTYAKLEGAVLLKDVDFSYDGKKQVLENITVDVKPGQKVAIIGKTGAGKTTISNLINRFYDIDDGKIRYDGININKIVKADLRKSLGVVLQEVNLFTGTVRENIRYGRLDATDDEVYAAAKLASADDFITRLPEGYDTVITADGANLSQGQRQLISIARVAVADPPVMILDEATSSIDTRTESLVQKGMDNLMKGRTVFVIAHRLSTVRNADNIMVLEQGQIVEQGTHDELMAKRGRYFMLQSGTEI